jgi:formylglycine-generating enzyme required for sulfatase activity
LLGFFPFANLATSDPPRANGKKYALLVGVRDYNKEELRNLKYTENDIDAMAEILKESGYQRVVVMTQTLGARNARYLPLADQIRKELKGLLEFRREGDTVILAFAGHGVQFKDEKESYFCPMDARLGDKKTLIALSEMYEQLNKCEASFKLLLCDACRKDPQVDHSRSREKLELESVTRPQLIRPPNGVAVLFSCSEGERAYESPELKHGVFFNFVIQGLKGKAANEDGVVMLGALSDYVQTNVIDYVKDEFGADIRQKPELNNRSTGAIPLVRVKHVSRKFNPDNEALLVKRLTNSIGVKLVLIPQGEFMMGSHEKPQEVAEAFSEEAKSFLSEHPLHRVQITKPFYLARHELTNRQFAEFVNATKYKTDAERTGSEAKGLNPNSGELSEEGEGKQSWKTMAQKIVKGERDDHPVVLVSWNDAIEFCKWLSHKEGRKYRLPTEAEWEYACRAGTTTRFWSGDDPETLVNIANVPDRTWLEDFRKRNKKEPGYKAISGSDGYAGTAPVGSFKPNPFGLYDMHGNVWEWCSDYFSSDYYGKRIQHDPTGPVKGEDRVIRGGCFQ